MPGRDYNADTSIDPANFVGSDYGEDVGSKSTLHCSNCVSCSKAGSEDTGKYCGCANLNLL
ncbi:hypothetical protein ColLi_00139 [Colletotrichum liriopes]|uniref:Uncharacterized protein n=1 Tax=Colletotrichum liriopes TaxID=708192 RepID=A0AA37GB88_9PEZI|nr:hypothetical protein ColLi_00139 [Colletotrichum liriopes]